MPAGAGTSVQRGGCERKAWKLLRDCADRGGMARVRSGQAAPAYRPMPRRDRTNGLRFLWLLVVIAGIFLVSQEMVGRLDAVTGAGHARPIYERPGSRWGALALSDLLIVNFLGSGKCRPPTMRPDGLAPRTGSCRAGHRFPGCTWRLSGLANPNRSSPSS